MKKFLKQKNKFVHKNFIKNFLGGFTLVETLVAISIFSLSVLAIMSFLSQNISDTRYGQNKIIGISLAQEGIEYIRNIRDSYVLYPDLNSLNWDSFVGKMNSCVTNSECGIDISVSSIDLNSIFLCSSHISQCGLYIDNGDYNVNLDGMDSGFVRKIKMELITPNEMKIYSTVFWTQTGKVFSNFIRSII
jgi:prepilin-type N-terminal cleavage/methylation domain-containing protein